ncbi:MAG: 50S ribosomal protein L15 [Nitrospirota bacterium]
MKIEDLIPAEGRSARRKRIGRGIGSGHGKTAGKGHKGQKARSGGTKGPGFEGGQMPLQRRVPKRGFKNRFRVDYAVLNLKDIDRLEGVDTVTPDVLLEKGIIKNLKDGLKILGDGEIRRPLTIKADAFSASALAKIAAAGGKAEVI